MTPDLSSVWKLSGVGKNGFSLEGEDADRDGMGGRIPKEVYEAAREYMAARRKKWGKSGE